MSSGPSLVQKLQRLQSLEKRWLLLFSVSVFLSLSIWTLLLGCLVDFCLRSDNLFLRLLQTALLTGVFVDAARRFLLPVVNFRRGLIDVARALESSHPAFGNRLSVATDFLQAKTEEGSSQLRQKVIQSAEAELDRLSLVNEVSKRWPMRALCLLATTGLIGSAFLVSSPQEFLFAMQRAVAPFSKTPWPSYNDLDFEDLPGKIATGDVLVCRVVDRNQRLPGRIQLEIENDQGLRVRQMEVEHPGAIYQINNVTRSLRIRATGGDDTTEWHHVLVESPPRVESLTIDSLPPSYSGLAPGNVSPFQKVWSGSSVFIRGKANRPFASGQIVLLPAGSRFPVPFGRTGIFSYPETERLTLISNTEFRIELSDSDGLTGGRQRLYRIPVRKDEPPVVEIFDRTGRELYAPTDPVEIEIIASDDMQLQSLKLRWLQAGRQIRQKTIPLPPHAPLPASSTTRFQTDSMLLVQLNELTISDTSSTVQLVAEAMDRAGNVSKSDRLSLQIGSPDDLENLGLRQLNQIHEEVEKALQAQQDAIHLRTLILKNLSEETADPTLNQRLQSLLLGQAAVKNTLFGAGGLIEKSSSFLQSSGNGGPNALNRRLEIQRTMEWINGIQQTARQASSTCNAARGLSGDPRETARQLKKAVPLQAEILEVLSELAGSIDARTRLRSCLAELQSILSRQKGVRSKTMLLQAQTLGNDLRTAPGVEFNRLVNAQKGIRSRLNEVSWGLLQDANQLDSLPLKSLAERTTLIEANARAATSQLEEIRLGLALQSIEQVISGLEEELQSGVSGTESVPPSSSSTIRNAKVGLQQLTALRNKITGQLSKWESLTPEEKEQLLQSISELQDRLGQFADQHRSTLSEKSNRKLREIRKLLDAVRQDLALGNLQKARSTITTTEQALNRIAAELDSRLAETSRQERYQRLQELQQEFLRWQKKEQMLESTLQSHPASEFPVHRDSLLQIQREISADMERCQKVHADLFALSSQLDALIKLSGRLETDLENSMRNPALSHAKSIIQQLEHLIEQPVQPPDENGQSVPPKNQQENGANGGSPDIQISEFEIQLIRLTQEEILAETRRIELAQSGDLPPAERHQLQQATLRLADRQAGLIATLQKYLGPADAEIQPDKSPQPLPDKIPDIPDIPGFDCGSQPPFQDPAEQDPVEQQAAEKRTNRETGNSARKPDIRSSSPFAKQGEDLGESPDSARNRLNSIREKMESVQQLLIQRKTERENQSIQNNIITELRQFATDQQKQSGKQSSKQNSGSETQKGNQAAKSSQATQPVGSDVENSNNQKSEEMQKRVDKIWGHLPNRIRRPELNIRSDDFLPNYRDLIKEYFKRLAREPVDR